MRAPSQGIDQVVNRRVCHLFDDDGDRLANDGCYRFGDRGDVAHMRHRHDDALAAFERGGDILQAT